MFLKIYKQKGFTLIELLVVIAIVSLLASVVLVGINNARSKARDTKRRTDLKALATALELYYSKNFSYPTTSYWQGNCADWGSYGTSGPGGWIPDLAPTYTARLPLDPKPIEPDMCYLYTSDGINYKILARGTVETLCPTATDPMYDPGNDACNFAVFTPGATEW